MATTLKVNPHNAKELLIESPSGKYVLNESGQIWTAVDAGEVSKEITTLSGPQRNLIIDGALREIEDNGSKLSPEVKAILPSAIKTLPELNKVDIGGERLGRLKPFFEQVEALESAADTTAANVIVNNHPTAPLFVSEAAKKAMSARKIDVDTLIKDGKKIALKATTVKSLNAELKTLLTVENPTKASVEKIKSFVRANPEHLEELTADGEVVRKFEAATGYNFMSAKATIMDVVEKKAAAAKPLMERLLEEKAILKLEPEGDLLKQTNERIASIETDLSAIYGDDLGKTYEKAIKAKLPAKLAEEVHQVSPKFGLTAGVDAAGKDFGLKFWNLKHQFTVTPELKAKKLAGATGKAETIAKIEKMEIGKFRWGKAGIVALPIAAVGAYFLAGTGNKPDGRAQAQMERRDAEPAVGRA